MVWCEVVWILMFTLEVFAPDLRAKIWLDQLQYLPGLILPILAVRFLLEFSGRRGRIWQGATHATVVVSALLFLMLMTNGLSGSIRPDATLVTENQVTQLVYAFTIWDYAAAIYLYLVFVYWAIYLLLYARRQPAYYRTQTIIVALGFLVPLLAFILYFLDIQIGFQRDPSPYAFTLANLIVGWGLLRDQLFVLRPIAGETVLERMKDAAFMVDRFGRMVDLNPAARQLIWLPKIGIGDPIAALFGGYPAFPAQLSEPQSVDFECEIQIGAGCRIFELTLTPLLDKKGTFTGHVVLLHDITRRKKIENDLRLAQTELEQRVAERTAELTQALALLSQSEEKFRAMVEQSSEGFVLVNPEGRIVEWNQAREHLIQIPREEALGEFIWDIQQRSVPEEYRTAERFERLRIQTLQALSGERTDLFGREFEISFRGLAGENGVMLQNVFPVQVGGERWLGSVSRDITERKRSEEKLRSSVERLNSLRSIDRAILSRMELDLTLKFIARQAQQELQANAVAILLLDSESGTVIQSTIQGDHACESRSAVGCLAEDVIRQRESLHTTPCRVPCNQDERYKQCAGVPIKLDGRVRGVIEIFSKSAPGALEQDLGFLEALAGQAAIAIDQSDLFHNLEQSNASLKEAYEATIIGWARALEIRDKETRGHTQRVTDLSLELARRLHLPSAQIDDFRHGVILHDIGKMLMPDSILLKPGPLTDEEWLVMRKHVEYGHDILSTNPFLSRALDVVDGHHEWWNGKGYPRGLREKEIPLGARIFSVVDVWDALIETRVYREAWPPQRVVDYIRGLSGEQFDPVVVEAFLELVQTRKPETGC